MIEFDHLTVGYRPPAAVIDNLTGRVDNPGLHLLEGPNGAGKSTLLEALSGHLVPWHGRVLVGGRPPRNGRHGDVTLVRTDPAFLRGVTMRDHCLLFAGRDEAALERIADGIEGLALEEHLDQAESALSSGTRKKMWTALLLARQTPVLALDEPFNAVDAASRAWICSRIEHEARTRQVIVASHDVPATWDPQEPVVATARTRIRPVTTSSLAAAAPA